MSIDERIPNITVPEGTSGNWRIERFTITTQEASRENLCLFTPGQGGRAVQPGKYTRLMRGSTLIMSDTWAEKRDHLWAVLQAKGQILINGLGLGVMLNACLLKPEVVHAIVVEKSPDVIALCGPHYTAKFGNRVQIVNADAFTYAPPKGVRFQMVWHDIWDSICEDNLPQMATLHRRYGKRTDWQGSWARELCTL